MTLTMGAESPGYQRLAWPFFYLFHILSDFVWYPFVSGTVTFGHRFPAERG
jgi:hypothetical protein